MVLSSDQSEATDGKKKAEASMLIVKADTIDEARRLIEKDVYYTSGVVRSLQYALLVHADRVGPIKWDTEKLIILPFVPATPLP